jgi:hypothetical protein
MHRTNAGGDEMADRSWFYASEGQQKGPYPEAQLHDLITRGTVRADTLVWTEGMSGWQKAGDIPGLVSGGSGPPSIPQSGGPVMSAGGYGGGALSIDLPVWAFLGRCLLLMIGELLVIPAPWVVINYYNWITPRFHVPGRSNLGFTGQVGDIWYVMIGLALTTYAGLAGNTIQLIAVPLQGFLSWMLLRWAIGNISANGQPIPMVFNGSVWAFVGWQVLSFLSFITIIGWAWVMTAFIRWICRNISGTRRELIFNGSGLEVLWRSIVFAIGCIFIIPIPWLLRWYTQWYVSQLALVERGAYAEA